MIEEQGLALVQAQREPRRSLVYGPLTTLDAKGTARSWEVDPAGFEQSPSVVRSLPTEFQEVMLVAADRRAPYLRVVNLLWELAQRTSAVVFLLRSEDGHLVGVPLCFRARMDHFQEPSLCLGEEWDEQLGFEERMPEPEVLLRESGSEVRYVTGVDRNGRWREEVVQLSPIGYTTAPELDQHLDSVAAIHRGPGATLAAEAYIDWEWVALTMTMMRWTPQGTPRFSAVGYAPLGMSLGSDGLLQPDPRER